MHCPFAAGTSAAKVRVRHELAPSEQGTLITYRCEVGGPEDVTAEVGSAVSADFPEVISALATRTGKLGA
jgi:hypothetical protein